MKRFFSVIILIVIADLIFASTLGSNPTYLEAKTKSVAVPLPKKIDSELSLYLSIRATYYDPELFFVGDTTATGTSLSFGDVAVSEDPRKRVLAIGSTFLIVGLEQFKGQEFKVTDIGPDVGEGQIDFFLGEKPLRLPDYVTIKVLTRGKS